MEKSWLKTRNEIKSRKQVTDRQLKNKQGFTQEKSNSMQMQASNIKGQTENK